MTATATPTTADPDVYARWRDFTLRMAQHAWPEMSEARRARLVLELTSFLDQKNPAENPWTEAVDSWDQGPGFPLCDSFTEAFDCYYVPERAKWKNTFYNQLGACVRAGIDAAARPTAGVVGFDVGLLRRMYDGTIPTWIADNFQPPLTADVPDDAPVWL